MAISMQRAVVVVSVFVCALFIRVCGRGCIRRCGGGLLMAISMQRAVVVIVVRVYVLERMC